MVEDLWDDIAAMPDDLPVSNEEKRILDERFEAHRASPGDALTLEEFKQRLSARL